MPVDPSSTALSAELAAPSVTSRSTVSAALRAHRPALSLISQQAAKVQALVAVAQEDESNPAIYQLYESLSQTLRSIKRQQEASVEAAQKLSTTLRGYEEEVATVVEAIARESEA